MIDRPRLLVEFEKSLCDEDKRQVKVVRELCEYTKSLEDKLNALQQND